MNIDPERMELVDHNKVDHNELDILCFGAHPDDVEIGMAGTIFKHVQNGLRVGIIDLTQAELSSNGTVEQRREEADQAANLLGVQMRVNMGFPDRGLSIHPDFVGPITNMIRTYKPTYVFVPDDMDRHPDHRITAHIVEEAIFNANIRKYHWTAKNEKAHDTPVQTAHKISQLYYYYISRSDTPHIVVDISAQNEVKQQALEAYQSQFKPKAGAVSTRLNQGFIDVIKGRDQLFGKIVDVPYAEGFLVKTPILLNSIQQSKEE